MNFTFKQDSEFLKSSVLSFKNYKFLFKLYFITVNLIIDLVSGIKKSYSHSTNNFNDYNDL